jgi:hypothetical protein
MEYARNGAGSRKYESGLTTLVVISFMGIFFLIMAALTGFAFEEANYGRGIAAREQALSAAEAGLDYYKWYLGHTPTFLSSGTAPTSPYTYAVNDPETGSSIGTATLTATPYKQCGINQWIDITSAGTASANSTYPRRISVRYMAPSVAQYAFLLNSNVWYGSTNVGNGPYFSNGGIREDGSNNSTVTSALSSFSCDSSMNCSPTQTEPGVFGSGGPAQFWSYPATSVNFAGIASNFSTLQGYAQSSGINLTGTATYVGGVQQGSSYSSVTGSDATGYHLVFNSNGTVTIYTVTGTNNATQGFRSDGECSSNGGWCYEYDVITSQTLLGTYTPPSGCGLIFVNAKAWVEGVVSGKVTVVVATTGSYSPDAVLSNNITYATTNGTSGLTLIAAHSVRIPINSPDTMNIRGIFVAQTGYYGRDLYYAGYTGGYDSYVLRTALNVAGSIVSNERAGVYWSQSGTIISGYQNRTNTYDQILAFNPPPFTPFATTNYGYVLWQEK